MRPHLVAEVEGASGECLEGVEVALMTLNLGDMVRGVAVPFMMAHLLNHQLTGALLVVHIRTLHMVLHPF